MDKSMQVTMGELTNHSGNTQHALRNAYNAAEGIAVMTSMARYQDMVNNNGRVIPSLIALLRNEVSKTDVEGRTNVCLSLCQCMVDNDSNQEEISRAGVLSLLITNLSELNEARTIFALRAITRNIKNLPAFLDCKPAVELMCASITNRSLSRSSRLQMAESLRNLAVLDSLKALLAELGCVEAIVRVLCSVEDAFLHGEAASILANLALDQSLASRFVALGALNVLSEIADRSEDKATCAQAGWALQTLNRSSATDQTGLAIDVAEYEPHLMLS